MTPLILRLSQSGQAVNWIPWQDAVLYYAKDQVAWTLGDETLRFYGGVNRIRNERSYMDIHPIIAVQGDKGRSVMGSVPTLNNRELFRRDGHTCMYCLSTLSERHLTRDHVIPMSRGGRNVWMNVVTACRACNQRKADQLLSETTMRLHAVPYTPNRAEWLILRNRHILADQMAFLEGQCPKDRRPKNDVTR
ncbi:HNH endonuclease family protein [hydrothermal vent metagenome]|uniref:HNH endonuclease family protein n=1 Tax=hydrothermal vent metagenome TaxID=652676 RepID=A0A3B1A2U3_9ZZZZ